MRSSSADNRATSGSRGRVPSFFVGALLVIAFHSGRTVAMGSPAVLAREERIATTARPTLAGGPMQDAGEGTKEAPPRSLDDLLGIPSTDSTSGEAATDRSSDRRLEQSLEGVNMQDLVARAMDGMREAARRLGQDRDAGLGTQRVQQDIVATLDRLLAEAQRQQQSSRGSSRSRSRQQQSSSDDPSENNGQSSSSSGPTDASTTGASSEPGSDETTGQRPADESAVTGAELDESRVEWGRLPERVRELILQGRRDRVSTLYERITREYYRRLAEEASR